MENEVFIKSSLNLNELCQDHSKYTFLVGAGISMNAPSKVPSARQIVENLLNYGALEEDKLNILDIDFLGYEIFVEIFQNNIDYNLRFLDYLEKITEPGNFINE